MELFQRRSRKSVLGPTLVFGTGVFSHNKHFHLVPADSPSRDGYVAVVGMLQWWVCCCGGYVVVYVFDINLPNSPTPFYSILGSIFCLCGAYNCVSSIDSPNKLSAFSLCSSGLTSALLVLSTLYLFIKVSFSPDIILCG